jgi:hypothetical protein
MKECSRSGYVGNGDVEWFSIPVNLTGTKKDPHFNPHSD